MKTNENELHPQDKEMLDRLLSQPYSEKELEFFTKLKAKMENEMAPCKEVHFSEHDNEDGIFLLRDWYEEFIIGTLREDVPDPYIHVMTLSDALEVNLKDAGFIARDLTLLDWLRERDYKGAIFDHNNAYM